MAIEQNMTTAKNYSKWGLVFGFLATLQWASYYLVGRYMFGDEPDRCDPFLTTLLRYCIAFVLFLPCAIGTKAKQQQAINLLKNDHKLIWFLAICGMILDGILVFYSLRFTTSARASLMANTSPIFTVIIAALWLKRPISNAIKYGMSIGIIGIACVMFTQNKDIFSNNGGTACIGDFLALCSGIAWAAYTVGGEKISQKYSSWIINEMTLLFAIIILIPMTCFSLFILHTSPSAGLTLTPRVILGTIYLAVFPCGIAIWCWMHALKSVPANQLGAFGYLSALLTTIFSVFILQEHITLTFIVSACLTITGIAIMLKNENSDQSN